MTETTHKLTEAELVALQGESMNQRDHLVGRCGCYYCLSTFMAERVREWTDNGQTALCPVCGIDTVLSAGREPTDADVLEQMHRRWFGTAYRQSGDGWEQTRGPPTPLRTPL